MSQNVKVDWKLLGAVGTIFLGGITAIAWADDRYAKKEQVESDKASIQQDLREIKADIKELLKRTK